MDGIGIKNLQQILGAAYQVLVDSGTTSGGSGTTLEDATKTWVANEFVYDRVAFTIATIPYNRIITSNTATGLTFAALPAGVTVPSGISYEIWRYVGVSDLTDRAARLLGVVDSLTKWGGTALTPRDISLDLAKLGLQRWGRDLEPEWVHAAEVTAPEAGTALVTKAVGAGKTGYIYGFLISAQETNDFKLNWTSGATAYSIRIPFGGAGSTECVDPTPLNEGLPADAGTDITITNVNAATAGKIYQARLLYAEV